jgi:REP element-mobilizing transposase RayT
MPVFPVPYKVVGLDAYGKYRIPSARLKNWDYGSNALYFVTICTENKICYFGNIRDGEMHLSDLGQLATTYWLEIENKFPFVVLGYFVVMPNHIHGIINIDKKLIIDNCRDAIYRVSNSISNSVSNDENVNITDATNQDAINQDATNQDAINQDATNQDAINQDAINRVSTVKQIGGVTGNNNPMLHENLSRFIHWYKGRCTFEMRKIYPEFTWQPRFHEHIIRDEESYLKIVEYIQNNPLKWQEDKYFL